MRALDALAVVLLVAGGVERGLVRNGRHGLAAAIAALSVARANVRRRFDDARVALATLYRALRSGAARAARRARPMPTSADGRSVRSEAPAGLAR